MKFIDYLKVFIYFFLCFFIFGVIVRGVVVLFYTGNVYIPLDSILKNLENSIAASFFITLSSLVFDFLNGGRKK